MRAVFSCQTCFQNTWKCGPGLPAAVLLMLLAANTATAVLEGICAVFYTHTRQTLSWTRQVLVSTRRTSSFRVFLRCETCCGGARARCLP